MKRKHSYREIARRHFSGLVVYCLKFPDDAEENIEFMSTDKQKDNLKRAIEVSKWLIEEFDRHGNVNLHQFAGFQNEIKNLLKTRKQKTLYL